MAERRNFVGPVLTAALLLFATSTALHAAKKAKAKPDPELDGLQWQALKLKAGEYFKYEVMDYTLGKKPVKNWVSLKVKEKGDKLEVTWEGGGDSQDSKSVTTSFKPERLIEMSKPALNPLPGATPFSGAVLALFWERVADFRWKTDSKFTVVFDEMTPMGFVMTVDDYCTVAGRKGFKSRMTAGDIVANTSCVSPRIPLPLHAVINETSRDLKGKPRFEARLLEYSITETKAATDTKTGNGDAKPTDTKATTTETKAAVTEAKAGNEDVKPTDTKASAK